MLFNFLRKSTQQALPLPFRVPLSCSRFLTWAPQYSASSLEMQIYDYNSLKERLLAYPYSRFRNRINSDIVEPDANHFMCHFIIKDATAYSAIRKFNQTLLDEYERELFDNPTGGLSGNQIFVKYFEGRLPEMMKRLSTSTNPQQLEYILKTLYNIQLIAPEKALPPIPKSLQSHPLVCTKSYLLALLKKSPDYLPFIEKFYKQLQQAPQKQQLQAALAVIAIRKDDHGLPTEMVDLCIRVVTANLQVLPDSITYKFLENIFQIHSPAVRQFVEEFTVLLFKQLEDSSGNIPTILKVLRMREKFRLDNTVIQNYVKMNPKKFASIFMKPRIKKQPFLQVIATKDSNRFLPTEIKIFFVDFILNNLKKISEAEECDSEQIIDTIKLCLKFYRNFSDKNVETIALVVKDKLIPMFVHEKETGFYLVTLLLRINSEYMRHPQIQTSVLQIKSLFSESYKMEQTGMKKHIALERINDINYQLVRSGLIVQGKSLLQYDYKYVNTPQQVIYACYVLPRVELNKENKYTILKSMSAVIEEQIKAGKVKSWKNLYILLGAIESAKCDKMASDKSMGHLYSAVEQGIMNTIPTLRQCPAHHQLLYIRKVFRNDRNASKEPKKEEGSNNHIHNYQLIKFVEYCLKDPQNFQKYAAEYHSKGRNKNKSNFNRN